MKIRVTRYSRSVKPCAQCQHDFGEVSSLPSFAQVATPAQAQEAHKNIRQFIARKVNKHVAEGVRIQSAHAPRGQRGASGTSVQSITPNGV